MATQPAYRPPSQDELLRQIVAQQPGIKVYRASTGWWPALYQGEKFWFPPDLGGKPVKHPITGDVVSADGVLEVRAREGQRWSEAKLGAPAKPLGHGVRPGMQANEITDFLVRKYGDAGVVILAGTPEQQNAAKEASRKTVYTVTKAWADREIAARSAVVEKFNSLPQNKGKVAPPPTDTQRLAQEWLDANAMSAATYEFNCEHGCYATDDYNLFRRHMKAMHSMDLPVSPVVPGLEPTVVNVSAEQEAAKALLAQLEAELEKAKARNAELDEREKALGKREAKGKTGKGGDQTT